MQASDQREFAAIQEGGGVSNAYLEKLQAARLKVGRAASPEFLRAHERELSDALAGRREGETREAFYTRTGRTRTAEEIADAARDSAAARAELAEASRHSLGVEWTDAERSGYVIPLDLGVMLDNSKVAPILAAYRAAGLTHAEAEAEGRAILAGMRKK